MEKALPSGLGYQLRCARALLTVRNHDGTHVGGARPSRSRGWQVCRDADCVAAAPSQSDILGDFYVEASQHAMINKWVFVVQSVTDSWPREIVVRHPAARAQRAI